MSTPLDVTAESDAQAGRTGTGMLRSGSLSYVRTLALSIGIQGPTAGAIIGPAIIASIVGAPGTLAQVLALGTMGFIAFAFVLFSRHISSAGSVYAFNRVALGPGYGFLSSWVLLFVYLSFAAGVYASTADLVQSLLASYGVHVSWVPIGLVGAALAIGLAYLSIRLSNVVVFALEGASILLLLVVGASVVFRGGSHHHGLSTSSLTPHGAPLGVLVLGVVAAFGQFSGFEGATLGEEAKLPRRTIPFAVGASLLISAGVYIFMTWISYVAYPSVRSLAAAPTPLVHIAVVYVGGWAGTAVNVAGVISAFGAQLACVNAAARIGFAVARDVRGESGVLRSLRSTSARFGSPTGALGLAAVVSIVLFLAFAAEPSANRAAALIIQYGAYLILVAYLMTVIAAFVWVARTSARVWSLGALTVGGVLLLTVFVKTFWPLPRYPFDIVALAAVASIVVGAAVYATPSFRCGISSADSPSVDA